MWDDMLPHLLDLLTISIIVTDGEGRILYTNIHGGTLLAQGPSLRNCMGRISAANPKSSLELRIAISECAAGNLPKANPFGIPVPILSEYGPDLTVWVLPLPRSANGKGFRRAAIFIRHNADAFSGELFARRFGATPAELRVLEMLLKGMTTEEISASLNISDNTVKTHLKNLFAKTGSSRQADLLRLVATALAPVAAPDS